MKYHHTLLGLLAMAVFTTAALAVSEEEIARMRQAMPEQPIVRPERPRTLLVFNLSKGFGHSSIPYWAKALDVMADKTGAFATEHSSEMAVFTPETLSRFDAICFNNTTALTFDPAQQKALMDFIEGGRGIVGIHAATDNFYDWPEAAQMMGGQFQGHPWNAPGTWAVKIDDPGHPLVRHFDPQGFKIKDEIYRTNPPFYSRDHQRVLLSLDMTDEATRTAEGMTWQDMDTGISWIKPVGQGRLFYCSLGHNHHLTWTTDILVHFLAGIQYALGDLKADDTPLGTPAAELDEPAFQATVETLKTYQWGQSRADAAALEHIIRRYYGRPEPLGRIEALMRPLLEADASPAATDFACRQLSLFATAQSVPALAVLLDNPETEHMARYALERIPDDSADAALLERLKQTTPAATKAGIINSLGVRRSRQAVDTLTRLAVGIDPTVTVAAVRALGMIASPDAASALMRLRTTPYAEVRRSVLDALARCADRLANAGNTSQAEEIYEALYAPQNPSPVRVAALTGLVSVQSKRMIELLPEAVASEDTALQNSALRLAAQIKDGQLLEVIVGTFGQLSDSAKVVLLAALAANGSPVGYNTAEKAMADAGVSVRLAAYQAIRELGGASSVLPLAHAAAAADSREEKDAARNALYALRGEGVDAAVEAAIGHTTEQQRDEQTAAELVRVIAERGMRSSVGVLFTTARDADPRILQESLRAIQAAAEPTEMSAMVDLLADRPAAATENTAVILAEKLPDRNQRSAALLSRWPSLESLGAKGSFLRVLGRLGDTHAIDLLREQFSSSEPVLRDAAFRAMTDWPGPELTADMKRLAAETEDPAQKVLAFRAYVRMLTLNRDKGDGRDVERLAEAMTLSDRPQEKRLVLGAMGAYASPAALRLALDAMAQPELKAEAEAAALGICERLIPTDAGTAAAGLQELQNSATQPELQERIANLLVYAEHITVWEMAGPYAQSGQNEFALFDIAFAPETGPDAAEWRRMPPPSEDKVWYMDFLRSLGGDWRVGYARTVLVSDEEADAVFEVGSDDGVKLWLNGRLVHENNISRGARPAQDKAPVRLLKGANTVMFKVTQGGGDWGFCLRVTAPDGTPIRGLNVKK